MEKPTPHDHTGQGKNPVKKEASKSQSEIKGNLPNMVRQWIKMNVPGIAVIQGMIGYSLNLPIKIGYPLFLLLLSVLDANAQNDMLIGQFTNKTVVRENFDKDGKFLNKQTFKAGQLEKSNGYYELEVLTELFDKTGKPKDKYTTTYRCDQNHTNIMVMVFPFSNPESKKAKISASSKDFKDLYNQNNIKEIELEIGFDSGLLNFFGSKSMVKIYDRKLRKAGPNVQITSMINVKAYALGIRIKQLNYTVNENLDNRGLLSFQKFTENDGSYFTMTYR